MNVGGRRVSKERTKQNIIDALPPGWKLIRINWKKGIKIHVADPHGRKRVISNDFRAPETTRQSRRTPL
jgi:hypothetical protein